MQRRVHIVYFHVFASIRMYSQEGTQQKRVTVITVITVITVDPEVSYGTGDSVTNVFNDGWVTARRSAATKIKWLASCSPCNPLCGLEIP